MGTAFSGTASTATDASTVFLNPAGMARLDGTHLAVGGETILDTFLNRTGVSGRNRVRSRPAAGAKPLPRPFRRRRPRPG
ncbi:MAG: outer membrane protein transport protein [Wenzhouxiangellaceae bacterium]|nr:outer membrane protein transport protein [Wenzhouxiangellaceae bacterium]